MASRYDQPTNEPDLDRYDTRTDDIDVPDFTAPDPPSADQWKELTFGLTDSIDPAEHACHAIIEALSTLEKEIVTAATLERARTLRRIVRDLWQHVTDVTDRAANKEDELVERLR